MAYTVLLPRRIQRDIDQLPTADARRIYVAIYNLKQDPRPAGCVKLTGRPAWRIRVGRYRVIYEIDDTELVITVVDVGHRRDVYR